MESKKVELSDRTVRQVELLSDEPLDKLESLGEQANRSGAAPGGIPSVAISLAEREKARRHIKMRELKSRLASAASSTEETQPQEP